ncbi:BRO family protein [Mixta sp. Marseille-Q2659]|uniref:BRO-N domain-containing protein n=1 Tax=Mixta sp. Marseille-Q2659 TaxID=2736607 RepID=UPI0023B9DCE6|nr:BRO family protein [Mixta sp. Marseille-Q2659]
MNNSIINQMFNNHAVRIVMKDGDPWFIAKDVAESLGYARPDKAVYDHCKKAGNLPPKMEGSLDSRLKVIPESDVYRLIFRSTLESAERFEEWVVEQVLPSIRKHGGYIQGQETLSIEDQLLIKQTTEAMARSVPVKMALLLSTKRSKTDEKTLHNFITGACMSSVLAEETPCDTLARVVNVLYQEGLIHHCRKAVVRGAMIANRQWRDKQLVFLGVNLVAA